MQLCSVCNNLISFFKLSRRIEKLPFISEIFGRGWVGNLLLHDENRINITIPIQHKPVLDKKYYNEQTGEYTAEGIAKAILPSVVSIEIFENGVALIPTSQGSGIILTENGYIITNAHVIENASRGIKVVFRITSYNVCYTKLLR